MGRLVCSLMLCLAACGNITRKQQDAGVDPPDDVRPIDAMIDAPMVQPPPTPARDIVGGAGRLTGTTFTMDVEIGIPFQPQKASGTTHTIQPNTAVQP